MPLELFAPKRDGTYPKLCDHCRQVVKEFYHKSKCVHNIYVYKCPTCRSIKMQQVKANKEATRARDKLISKENGLKTE